MEPRKTILALCLLLPVLCTFAQAPTGKGSRFGHGADSLECLLNIGQSYDLVAKGKYKKAYVPWRKAISTHPRAQVMLYTNGARILRTLIRQEKDPQQRKAYVNELCDLYDLNLTHLDDLNTLQLRPTTRDVIYMRKAHDYLNCAGECLQLDRAYDYIRQAVQASTSTLHPQLLEDWMKVILLRYQADPASRPAFQQDYARICSHAQTAFQQADPAQKPVWEHTLQTIRTMYQRTL